LRWQAQALQAFREQGNRAYELRVHGGMARAALALEDLPAARRHVAAATALATAHRLPLPSSLQLQAARVERRSGERAAATARLDAALADAPAGDLDRPALLEELAAVQEAGGDRATALDTLRRAHAEGLAQARARHDRELGWQRTRFETAERDRRIAALEADKHLRDAELRQRTLVLGLIAALAIAVALAVWLYQQRQRQRERLREEAHRVRQEQMLAHWRREADALAEDRGLLQALFDSREDAVCLLDAEGHVLAANRAACAALGAEPSQGQALVDHLAEPDHDTLVAALERMEDSAAQTLPLRIREGRALEARLSQWPHGDGLLLLCLQPPGPARDAVSIAQGADTVGNATVADADVAAPTTAGMREDFRRALVELMLAVVEAWERSTGSSRLELAEKSRVWRVTVDDGRLRARAMERYLSLSKLPNNPRWRDVLRSAYFVLGHCTLEPASRETLQARLDAVLAYTRRSALV
jgi:PAS domain-containing protein